MRPGGKDQGMWKQHVIVDRVSADCAVLSHFAKHPCEVEPKSLIPTLQV